MRFHQRFFLASLSVAVLAPGLQARNVFFLPADSANRTVQVFSTEPFASVGSFTGAGSIFHVSVLPNGSKYYFVSRTGTDTIVVVDGTLQTVLKRLDLGVNAQAAALTPDGTKLLVIAGRLYVFNTATDTELAPLSQLDLGTNPFAIVVNHESTRAFVLSQSRLTAVDLISNAVISPVLPIPGSPTDVAVTPHNNLIVTALNRFYLIDGRTMTQTAEVPLNGRPRALRVTPDGRFALAINETPITGSPLALLDIAARTASLPPVPSPTSNALDQLVLTSNDRAYAITQGRQLAGITLNPFNFTITNYPGVGTINSVTAMAASQEIPSRFLFVSTPSTIYRLDPGTNQVIGNVNPSLLVAGLAVVGPPGAVNPATAPQFNAGQTIGASGVVQPLILRALGVLGEPLYNIEATITTTTTGVIFNQGNARTNANGYALFNVSVPTAPGTYQVVVTLGGITLTYTINVTGATTPGAGGIAIFSGNGQGVREQFNMLEPMVVLVSGPDGKPLPGVPVTFEITQGFGTLSVTQAVTDNEGKASTLMLATNVSPGLSYSTATISAASPAGTVSFVVTTLVNVLLGGGLAADPLVQIVTPPLEDRFIRGRAGEKLTAALRVLVVAASGGQTGQPIPNIGVRIRNDLAAGQGPTATCVGSGNVALTGQDGIANCDVILGGKPGRTGVTIDVGNFRDFQGVGIDVGLGLPAVAQIVSGNNQTGNAGVRLPNAFVARITDGADNILAGEQVIWEVATQNSLTLANVIAVSDQNGLVSAVPVLGNIGGTFQVRVRTVQGVASAVFAVTVTIPVSAVTRVSGDQQTIIVGQTFPNALVVRVTNSQGAGVPNVRVNFVVSGGAGSINPASTTTDANGNAQTFATSIAPAGTIIVTAQVGAFSVSFTLASRPPQPVFSAATIFNAAGFQSGFISPCGLYEIVVQNIAAGLQGVVFGSNPYFWTPLPYSVRGVSVRVGGADAPVHSVRNENSRESVVIQVPCEVQGPLANVAVSVNNLSSSVNVPVLASQPAIFEYTQSDNSRLPIVFRSNGSIVADDNPAQRGEEVTIVTNSLGQTTPAWATNRVGVPGQAVATRLVAGVNDAGVTVVSAEAAPLAGLYFVKILIPLNTAAGRRVNLGLAAVQADGSVVFANGTAFPLN